MAPKWAPAREELPSLLVGKDLTSKLPAATSAGLASEADRLRLALDEKGRENEKLLQRLQTAEATIAETSSERVDASAAVERLRLALEEKDRSLAAAREDNANLRAELTELSSGRGQALQTALSEERAEARRLQKLLAMSEKGRSTNTGPSYPESVVEENARLLAQLHATEGALAAMRERSTELETSKRRLEEGSGSIQAELVRLQTALDLTKKVPSLQPTEAEGVGPEPSRSSMAQCSQEVPAPSAESESEDLAVGCELHRLQSQLAGVVDSLGVPLSDCLLVQAGRRLEQRLKGSEMRDLAASSAARTLREFASSAVGASSLEGAASSSSSFAATAPGASTAYSPSSPGAVSRVAVDSGTSAALGGSNCAVSATIAAAFAPSSSSSSRSAPPPPSSCSAHPSLFSSSFSSLAQPSVASPAVGAPIAASPRQAAPFVASSSSSASRPALAASYNRLAELSAAERAPSEEEKEQQQQQQQEQQHQAQQQQQQRQDEEHHEQDIDPARGRAPSTHYCPAHPAGVIGVPAALGGSRRCHECGDDGRRYCQQCWSAFDGHGASNKELEIDEIMAAFRRMEIPPDLQPAYSSLLDVFHELEP